MRPTRLDATQIDAALCDLPLWQREAGPEGAVSLHRDFVFPDFNAAFGFMSRVAMMAERLDHHPDWSNTYNRVTINLSTHDAGGVTELDLRLARFCDAVVAASEPAAKP
ncbi:MAG: pterin-4-alpha-carbinolamine dehydratase [Rhodocyclales bacterium]|nr:pterin-4-alpha-carbinolamine dehydratase [Rhodocyclales bacterium]